MLYSGEGRSPVLTSPFLSVGFIFPRSLMQVETMGDFGIRIASQNGSMYRILAVSISPSGASYQITIRADNGQPPYRIDNR